MVTTETIPAVFPSPQLAAPLEPGVVGAVDDGAAPDAVDELSGPVRKKVPAMGVPSCKALANMEILKLVRGVLALTNGGALVSKSAD